MVEGEDRRQPGPRRPGRGRAPRGGLARDHNLGVRVEDGGDAKVVGGAVAGVAGVRDYSRRKPGARYDNSKSSDSVRMVRSTTRMRYFAEWLRESVIAERPSTRYIRKTGVS